MHDLLFDDAIVPGDRPVCDGRSGLAVIRSYRPVVGSRLAIAVAAGDWWGFDDGRSLSAPACDLFILSSDSHHFLLRLDPIIGQLLQLRRTYRSRPLIWSYFSYFRLRCIGRDP